MSIIRNSRVLYRWSLPVIFGALVFKLSLWCGAEGYVSGLRAAACKPDTGLTPIVIKAEEETQKFNTMRGNIQNEIDTDETPKNWLHPAEFVRIIENPYDEEIQIYTDGSKKDNGVRAGIVIKN